MIKYLSDRSEWTLKLKQLEQKSLNNVKFRLSAFSIKIQETKIFKLILTWLLL